jgi:hypothetical protein
LIVTPAMCIQDQPHDAMEHLRTWGKMGSHMAERLQMHGELALRPLASSPDHGEEWRQLIETVKRRISVR